MRKQFYEEFTLMSKFLILVCLSVLLLIYVGCDSIQKVVTSEQEPTVKIGFVVAGERVTYPNGAEMAVTEINQRGGLLGMPVELIGHINKEAMPEVSVQIAETLIVEDEIIALIGPNRSSHAVEVGPVAQRYGIPMVTTTATNPNVTNAGDFVFMASFTDSFQGAVMAQFAIEDLDITTAAVITRKGDLYTEGIAEFFALNFSKLGGEIVANEFYEGNPSDFTAQLTSIAAATPDALFTAGFVQDIAFITQQARAMSLQNEAGEPTIFLGADSWDSELLFDNEDAEVEGSFSADTSHRTQMNPQHARLLMPMNPSMNLHRRVVSLLVTMQSNCFLKQSSEQAVSTQMKSVSNSPPRKTTSAQRPSPVTTKTATQPKAQ